MASSGKKKKKEKIKKNKCPLQLVATVGRRITMASSKKRKKEKRKKEKIEKKRNE